MKNLRTHFDSIKALLRRAGRLMFSDSRAALLTLRLAWWVAAISVLARLLPLPRALSLIAPRRPIGTPCEANAQAVTLERLSERLDVLLGSDVLFWKPICWKRAAVLYRYLALAGINSRIVFGMCQEGEGLLTGHAWVEVGGQPVFEATPPRYTPTYHFP